MSHDLRRPLGPPDEPEPFIGRDRDIASLGTYLSDERQPNPRILVLHGAPGVGKSALAARLARDCGAQRGLPVCWMPMLPNRRFHDDPEVPHLRVLGQLGAERRLLFHSPDSSSDQWRYGPYTAPVGLPDLVHTQMVRSPAVVVFDDVSGRSEADLLLQGFEGSGAVVIFTSDSDQWAGGLRSDESARIYQVRPLDDAHAALLLGKVDSPGPYAQNLPLFLRIVAADHPPASISGPGELVARALRRLGSRAEELLFRLARSDLREFDEEMVRTVLLSPPYDERPSKLIETLCASGLAQRVRGARFQVHPAVQALLDPDSLRTLSHRWRRLHDVALDRLEAALDGTGPPVHGEMIDDCLKLIQQMIRVPSVGDIPLSGTLARYLAEQGDPHRLFALRAIVAHHALPDTAGSLVVPMAVSARHVGQLDQADHLLRMVNPHEAAAELALVLRDSGRLREAIAALDQERPDGSPVEEDPSRLLARGAVRCDQGWSEEAEKYLARAAFGYEERKSYRDLAWARLEQGRCQLLLGHLQSAERLFDAAGERFRNLEDARGLAWVATESGRRHMLLGTDDAPALLDEAWKMHQATEDARGASWTSLYQLLSTKPTHGIELRARILPLYLPYLPPFDELRTGDWQLEAWARHFAVVLGAALLPSRDLLTSASFFKRLDCRRGQAWSLLASGLRTLATSPDEAIPQAMEQIGEASRLFESVGDATAQAWQQYVRCQQDIPQRLGDVLTPARPALDLPSWWQQPSDDEVSAYDLPLLARLTMLPVTVLGQSADEPAGASDACRVRLTLLDDAPAVHTDAHILLRVEPGARHPWADLASAPYLQAIAVPLTRGTLAPPLALFRASAQAKHGAEFQFRSERPGRHRLRFTIVDEASGTVLHQLETEVDLTDATPDQAMSMPWPDQIGR
ncbi:AAA family ATPase [Streptomyces sp. NPDC005017]|uniref:AAA family ATPase n=1 Tax=Streptomyces sp. NPDC005017 TaxID=3364706 RepID=UPI00367B0631